MQIARVLIIFLSIGLGTTLSYAQNHAVFEMQCPKVRDYGGYPHTTGEMISYRFDRLNETVSRRTNNAWTVICKGSSQCSIEGDVVLISEIRASEKKLIDRRLDFVKRIENAQEWGNPDRTRLVFGYESQCKG